MRVFISSVMQGFEAEREVAREVVDSLGMQPVMAERFGARPVSSKQSCIEGVREADCYLGIFGDRYGWIAPSGISPTHEEFNEAVRLGRPVLMIIKDPAPDREPRLSEFLREVGEYESGYFRGTYRTPTDLATSITRALSGLTRSHAAVTPVAAATRLRPLLTPGRDHSSASVLTIAATPADATAPVDVRMFGAASFQTALSRAARYDAPVFRENLGSRIVDGPSSIALVQHGDGFGGALNTVELHTDRTVAVGLTLDEPGRRWPHAGLEGMILDEGEVRALAENALRFLAHAHSKLLTAPPPPRLYIQASLVNLSGRLFGHRPKSGVQGLSLGGDVDDPLVVPAEPALAPLSKVAEAADIADQLREHFARAFRAGGAYFTPSRGR